MLTTSRKPVTTMAWTKVFNGLEQGGIDGQDNAHLVNVDQKFWAVQKYTSDRHYLLWTDPILVSETR